MCILNFPICSNRISLSFLRHYKPSLNPQKISGIHSQPAMFISTAKHRIRPLTSRLAAGRSLCTAVLVAAGETAEESKVKKRARLYRQLSALRGDPNGSVTATMERWENEGISVSASEVMDFVRQLRKYRDFKHALEVNNNSPNLHFLFIKCYLICEVQVVIIMLLLMKWYQNCCSYFTIHQV